MVDVNDYVGKQFASFKIIKHIGGGAEAEVYLCQDQRNGLPYALRLDIADDQLWDAEPVLPPVNASLERANVRGSWGVSGAYPRGRGADSWKIHIPTVYGVYEEKYVVPLSARFRVKDVLDLNQWLPQARPDDTYLFETWETIALQILIEAADVVEGRTSESAWSDRWKSVPAGPIMYSSIETYMKAGTLAAEQQEAILKLLKAVPAAESELAESLVLRLVGAVERGRMSAKASFATLHCPHFRRNLGYSELDSLVLAYNNVKSSATMHSEKDPVWLLGGVLFTLADEVIDEDSEEQTEERTNEPQVDSFNLFLQEFAGGGSPPLPKLERTRT